MQETKVTQKGLISWSPEDAPSLKLRRTGILMDYQKVGAALLECLIDNDTESFIEILDSYLRINRLQVSKNAQMVRSTVQSALSKTGNPTLKTLAKIVHESSLKR